MKMKTPLIAAALLTACLPSAHALVAVGNGNYFKSFTDVEHEAPANSFQLKVTRVYNSRSQFDGIFGYGWGSDFEAFLVPSVDGGVVVQESGGGDKTRFSPKEFSKADLAKQVDRLVEAYGKKEKGSGVRLSELREKLLSDAGERDELSRSLGIFPQLPEGTKLFTTQRGDKQAITVVKGGFLREFADGKREFFNTKVDVMDQGVVPEKARVLRGVYKVSRVSDPLRKLQLFYEYDAKGNLVTVTDKKSQKLRFRYNEAGKVREVSDSKGEKATYEYCSMSSGYNPGRKCSKGDLVRTRDTAGGVYSYQYDDLRNMIRVGYPKNGKPDAEFETVTYWPARSEGLGGTRSVKDTSGTLTEYAYWQDPKDREMHYKTEVTTTFAPGSVSKASYEYFEKKRSDGSRYRYKMISVADDEKTETIYNECCGQPVQITNPSGVTKFEYYAGSGLPKEKDSPTENVKWEYSPKFHGKITKVTVNDKVAKTVLSSEFSYEDKNGQLTSARTSEGKGIAIFYDTAGRIGSMVDQDKRKILFKYEKNSKPSEIIQDGVGSIQVIYDKAGVVKEVKSKGGREIAVSVGAAFQNLLEIIKPAGIQPI